MSYGNIVGYTTNGQPIYSTAPVDTPRLNFPIQNGITNQPKQEAMLWVDGYIEAKSYRVAPGSTVVLWDSDAGSNTIYIKSTDANGIPQKMRVLKYDDVTDNFENGEVRSSVGPVVTMGAVEELIDKKLEAYSNAKKNRYSKNRNYRKPVKEEYDEE